MNCRYLGFILLCLSFGISCNKFSKVDSFTSTNDTLLLNKVSLFLYNENNYNVDSAIYLLQKVTTKNESEAHKNGSYFLRISQIYNYQGKLALGMKFAIDARSIFKTINDTDGLNACKYQIGVIAYQEKNYAKADSLLQSTSKYYKQKNTNTTYYENLYLLGLCNIELNQLVTARKNLSNALTYFESNKSLLGQTECISGLAQISYLEKQYPVAITLYTSVLKKSELSHSRIGKIIAQIGLGKTYKILNKADSSVLFNTEALHNSIETKYYDGILEASNNLWELHKANGNLTKANYFQQIYYSTRDSIYNQQTARNIAELESQAVIDQKKTEINALQESKKSYQIWILIFAIVILFGSLVIYLFYKSSKTKQRLNDKLTASNEELKQSQIQILKLQKYKESFLANITHELRTPLNAIKGISDLLSFTNNDDERKELVNGLKKSSNHLLNMVNDFLDFSKLKEGKLTLRRQPFQLQNVIKSAINLLRVNADEKQLTYTLELHQMPETVMGDESRLIQILVNIIGNSIKFTSSGFVKVVGKGKLINENNCEIEITISDSGIGISSEKIKSIFEDYEQADENIAATFGGTGLGLGICKRLIEQHQGAILCESELGKGTTFIIKLPYEYLKINEIEIKELQNFESLTTQKATIIIADDNEMNLLVAEKLLGKNMPWATLLRAENGQQVIDLMAKSKVDIVLMDMKMPVMNGVEASKIIRANKSIYQPHIIAMTAGTSDDDITECYEAGMNDYLPKPYHIEVLLSKIQKILEQ